MKKEKRIRAIAGSVHGVCSLYGIAYFHRWVQTFEVWPWWMQPTVLLVIGYALVAFACVVVFWFEFLDS